MSNYFDDVGRFHGQFDLPVSHETWAKTGTRLPGVISTTEFNFRIAFLFEELKELIEGNEAGDLGRVADALVDLVWVALGTAHYCGLPFDALWKEVQRANMEKRPWREGDPIKPRNAQGLEIVKPDGWVPPDIEGVLTDFQHKLGVTLPTRDSFVLDDDAFGNGAQMPGPTQDCYDK